MDNDSNKSKNSVEISATPQSTPSNKDGTIDVKSVDFNQYLNVSWFIYLE